MYEQARCAHEPPSDEGREMMHRRLWRSAAFHHSDAFYNDGTQGQRSCPAQERPFEMGSALKRILGMVDPRASWLQYLICAWILLSLGLAILDPSASRGLGFFLRLLFWLAHVGGGIIVLEAVQIALGRTALVDRLHPWAQVLLAGVIGAFFLSAFSFFVLDPLFARSGPEAGDDGSTLTEFVSELRFSAGAAVLFWLLLNGPRLLTIANQQETDRTLAASDPEDVQALKTEDRDNTELQQLLRKLPPSIGLDLVALSAELHYLRVYTVKGNALILMSFGKAIQAVTRVRGVAIHRSHWVAVDHIDEVQTQGGRVLCRMSTGLVLPVSRSGRAPLKLADEERRLEQAGRDAARLRARRKNSRAPSRQAGNTSAASATGNHPKQ